jgi:hypothetical protein
MVRGSYKLDEELGVERTDAWLSLRTQTRGYNKLGLI